MNRKKTRAKALARDATKTVSMPDTDDGNATEPAPPELDAEAVGDERGDSGATDAAPPWATEVRDDDIPEAARDSSENDETKDEGAYGPDDGLFESEAPTAVEPARELSLSHLRGLLESLVFASDKPLKAGELARLASAPLRQVRELLEELKETYASRGVVLDEVAGGWLFRTNAQYAPFVRELTSERPVRLTRAQIETLAIAAYRQPITRPEIDDIRGVDSGATLKLLLERDLVRILGKKDEPGRPILYGTTTAFLELFGLKSLKDLPTLKEFTELNEDSRRVAEATLEDVTPERQLERPVEHDTVIPASPAPPENTYDDPAAFESGSPPAADE